MIPNSYQPVCKGSSVNVLYFTNRCNFRCKYCYEHLDDSAQFDTPIEVLKESVDKIIKSEPEDTQTLFVMFGGEVTLAWNNAKEIMNYALMKKPNVYFNISSNGYRFKSDKFIEDYTSQLAYKAGKVSLDISFDGIGNFNRVTVSGKSTTETTIEVFKKLHQYNVPFRVRYTIHKANAKCCYDDIIKIANTFKPERVITSINYKDFTESEVESIQNLPFLNAYTSGILHIPVCSYCCKECKRCSVTKESRSYYGKDGYIGSYKYDEIAGTFSDFD